MNRLGPISSLSLYNMMTDQRHLLLIDLQPKPAFELKQIRGSCNIFSDFSELDRFIEETNRNAEKNEEKYRTQKVRRLVFVSHNPEKIASETNNIQMLIESIQAKDFKAMYLKVPLGAFLEKYPFFSLSAEVIQGYNQNTVQISAAQEQVLFSYSQFPAQIIEDEIFLGSVLNSNSKRQLNALRIKSVIDFKCYQDQEKDIKEWKRQEFNHLNIPILAEDNVVVDFDWIVEKIEEAEKPVLLVCQDGTSVSSCMAIAYLMSAKKKNYSIASLAVFQARGSSQVNKKLYSQLLTFHPTQKKQQQQ